MGLFKCCVGGCNATSKTHRLYCFPKNDSLRNLWMSFLVPSNSLLIGLTKEQLLRKRVCEKHFDKQQFDEEGKRLRYSYPCLVTDVELKYGEPMPSAATERNVLSDHNYCRKEVEEDDDVANTILVIGRAGENFHEHPSCSKLQPVSSVTERQRGENFHEHPSCSNFQPVSSVTERQRGENFHEHPSCSNFQPVSSVTERQRDSVMKKFIAKKKKFIRKVTNISSKSLDLTVMQRLKQAVSCRSNEKLLKNFHLLSKQAQTFLLMQLKQCQKNKMARRFTLDEKLIALVLMKQSPKSYRLLENMFALPNKRTLHRISEQLTVKPGFNMKIFNYIAGKTKYWNTDKKLCTIVFDEIALTPHLTYNEKADIIYGFVDIADERKMKFCDHALVFMVRGVCSSWRQSIAFYFCEGTVSAAALQNILNQLVLHVAQTGLIPIGLVCDQGATFRTAIKSLREKTEQMRTLQNINDDGTINIAGHNLSIFFDPPHLFKGLRNNFLNKNIIWEGKTASWKDIQFIYDLDSKLGHTRALPKLTAHHVNPDKIKKMKVSVAAQVFSARTAAMLKYTNALNNFHTGNTSSSTMETTAEVVEFFDNLFDSVNCHPGGAAKGKLRKAVKVNSPHLQFWTEAIKKIKKITFEDTNSKLAVQAGKPRFVRVPSLDGWVTTLESFIRISKLLFEKYAIEYYYPRNINQDPLENFFGRIRALNYRNVNPDANTFIYAFKSLLLSNLLSPHSKFANCEDDNGDTLIDANFFFKDDSDENFNPNISITSTFQHPSSLSGSITKDEVILEKIKVQCSAYTAGYICRKMSKKNNCKSCLKTYTSSSTEDNLYSYIRQREFKMLKNNNLAYPSSKLLVLYRDASTIIHNFLNENCHNNYIGQTLKLRLDSNLKFSLLGCQKNHSNMLKNVFMQNIIRLHVHNWSNILNKILKGDIEEKYVSNMSHIQKYAYKKYVANKLRKRAINK